MRRLKNGRFARTLASFLIVLFGGPSLLGWSLLLPAGAQITTQTRLQLVAIVPFENLVKGQSDLLAEQATNAIAQALLDTQVYDVRPIEESKQRMADLGLRAPMTEAALDRLGEAMGVGGVVFGEVRSAGIRKLTRSSQGEVTLMVAIYDVATGTIRNGTIVTGKSSFASGEIEPARLVDEALNQAAYQAIKEIQSNRPIAGIVQSSRGKEVTLNIGNTSGVRETMKFAILREGNRVGIVEVGRVDQVFSDAKLLEGQARVGDRVIQVFVIPAKGTVVPLPGEKKAKEQGWGKLALAVLAGLVLAGMSKSSGASSEPEGLTAAAISNIVDSGVLGVPTTDGTPDNNFIPGAEASVQVRWGAPKSAKETILGYEIWIDGIFWWFTQGMGEAGRVWINPLVYINTFDVYVEVDENTGTGRVTQTNADEPPELALNSFPIRIASYFDLNEVHPTVITYTLNPDYVLIPYKIGQDTIKFLVYVGHWGGERHVYQVRKVAIRRYQAADGTYLWELYRETLPSRAVVATLLAPPTLQVPANNELVADATAVTFGFNAPPGADDYILQVSLDSQFSKNVTSINNLTLLDGTHSTSELLLSTQNLVNMLGSLPSGTTVFWRVGARWRGDTFMPLPYPKIGKNPPDSYRYVFARYRQVVVP